jgi:hypothetical protein
MTNRQLVLATGVSRGWRKFIFQSPMLRKKLFLEADLRPAQHCRLFMDDKQIDNDHPTGYLYMVPGEDDAAKGNTDDVMIDWPEDQVQEIYEGWRLEPPWAKRYKIVAACPMLEPEGTGAEEFHRKPAFERKIRGFRRKAVELEEWEWEDWKEKKGWSGWENELLRSRALNSGTWRQMFLTAPPVDRVVVGFEWIGRDSEGALARIKGNRVIHRSSGVRCECLMTGYQDIEGDLEILRRPSVAREKLDRVEIQEKHNITVRACLTELESAGFKMKQKLKNIYSATISGVVIPTPAELVAMQRPIEVLRLEHDNFYRQQEFEFVAAERQENGEAFDEDHYMESLPLDVRYPEETAEWEHRVELAEWWKWRASRRWWKWV